MKSLKLLCPEHLDQAVQMGKSLQGWAKSGGSRERLVTSHTGHTLMGTVDTQGWEQEKSRVFPDLAVNRGLGLTGEELTPVSFSLVVFSPTSFLSAEDSRCMVCDAPGELHDLLFCTSCGLHYHGTCLEITVTPRKRSGWQCHECKVCQTCRCV